MAGQGFVPNEGKGGLANGSRSGPPNDERSPKGAADGDQRQGDREPQGVTPRVQGGPEDRGGMAGPNVGGSGVHGLQDDVNRGGPKENATGVPGGGGVLRPPDATAKGAASDHAGLPEE